MPMHSIEYAVLCVVAPVTWGVIVYWVSGRIERRVAASAPSKGKAGNSTEPDDTLPLEYHI